MNHRKINESYFREWTNNMAYTLGFITADGCVGMHDNSYSLSISSNDIYLLENIRDDMKSDYAIGVDKTGCGHLSITNRNVVMDVMAHGIMPRKSWNPVLPDVPVEYRADLIRGVFDGDGTVYISKDSTKGYTKINSEIIAIRKPFLQDIGNIIRDLNGSIPKIYCDMTRVKRPGNCNPMYKLLYPVKESIALYHALYDDCTTFHLIRKREKFEKWLIEQKHDINWGLRECTTCGKKFVNVYGNSYICFRCRRVTQDNN
jgi:hypothetical protein